MLRSRLIHAVICVFPAICIGRGILVAQDHSGVYPESDVRAGARLYQVNCTRCHGVNGDGIPGIALKTGIHRAATDDQVAALITAGIPGTAMPATAFSPREAEQLVAYLRSMSDFGAPTVLAGDVQRGRVLFEGDGQCSDCHRIYSRGSRAGPDLSDVGVTRGADAIWNSILDPTASMRPINRPVRIVTADGDTVLGRRLNEDTYTVQIVDEDERLRSFIKQDLREFTIMQTSTMPSYGDRLSRQEIADLVAYLMSLGGTHR